MKLTAIHHAKPRRNNAEEGIQRAIVQRLRLHLAPGVWFCAVPNGEARSKATGGRLKAQGVIAGTPDLIFCIHGLFYGLELKAPGGYQSKVQRDQEVAIKAAKGRYVVAKGIDDAYAVLESWGVFERAQPREAAE